MIQEIRAESLELQIAKVGNAGWDQLFPDTMPMEELVAYTEVTVDRLDTMGKKLVGWTMALGRLMDIASKRSAPEWKEFGYSSFTDFQDRAYAKISSHGSRFTAMRTYRQLADVPMEELEKCPVGNLNAAAKLMASHDYSESQKRELLASAAKSPKEFQGEIASKALTPPGEESMRSILVRGHKADAEYLSSWLEREDIAKLGGTEIERILCAAAELDSTGPNVVLASVILHEITRAAEKLGSWDTLLDETFTAKVKEWLAQGSPTVEREPIEAEFEERQ